MGEPFAFARHRWISRAISIGLILLSVLLLCLLPRLVAGMDIATAWYASPAMFPALAMLIIIIGGAAQLWQQRALPAEEVGEDEIDASASRAGPALVSLLGLVFYTAGVPVIGFAPATLFFVTAMLLWSGLRWWAATAIGLLAATSLHLIFVVVFGVWFPEPSIISVLNWMLPQ